MSDAESGAPFGEAEPHVVIFAEASGEGVEAFRVGFAEVVHGGEALVDFDAGDDAFADEKVWDSGEVVHVVAGGFVK